VLDPRSINSEADLLTVAIHIDQRLTATMNTITTDSPQLDALAREVQQQISSNENALAILARSNSGMAADEIHGKLAQLDSCHQQTAEKTTNPDLQRLSIYCDRSFAFYDAIVESTADEATMVAAQRLTSSALDRIGMLKQVSTGAHKSAET
jgi:hypothetical protein